MIFMRYPAISNLPSSEKHGLSKEQAVRVNPVKILFKNTIITATLLLLLSGISTMNVDGQANISKSGTAPNNAIKLFIDCGRDCDMDYIRENIPYVNYVRDVKEAELYLLVTEERTGSGGENFSLFFVGQEQYEGMRDTLYFSSGPDNTRDVTRRGLTHTMALGLMRYVAKTPARSSVLISYLEETTAGPMELTEDNWNHWVFQIGVEPNLSLEQKAKEFSWELQLEANRITSGWKLENEFEYDFELEIFIRDQFDDDTGEYRETRTEAVTRSWEYQNLTVKSLNNHWSAGIISEVESSTYRNLDLSMILSPAIEYNIFPYSQSNQKQLTFLYGMGLTYNDYVDTTIFNKTEERLMGQMLNINLEVQQRWGFANISLRAENYLHDFQKYLIELDGYLNIRLYRGLSLSLNGRMAFIHNQIELAKGDRSAEDVYLRLRELQTNYRYDLGIGLQYTFGSIYSNIVNPRF